MIDELQCIDGGTEPQLVFGGGGTGGEYEWPEPDTLWWYIYTLVTPKMDNYPDNDTTLNVYFPGNFEHIPYDDTLESTYMEYNFTLPVSIMYTLVYIISMSFKLSLCMTQCSEI